MGRKLEDYDEIKEGMKLRCISENYTGDVIMENGVLKTNCCGWGYEPIFVIDIDDIEVIKESDKMHLQSAVEIYYHCYKEAGKCTELLLSNPIDPKPAEIMWALENARVNMFELAGIDVTEERNAIEEAEKNS